SYPSVELQQAAAELRAVVETEALVPAAIRRQLGVLLTEIAEGDIYDLQERYVLLFDRTRSLSLHLFEHVHGESRDRGQAMVDLLAMYEDKGLGAIKSELPDYLPLFLEFLATLPQAEGCDLLGQPAHILGALAERLRKRGSAYEAVLRALVALSSVKPKGEEVSALLALPDPDPLDLAALDAAWEDEPVQFGPGAADSCKDGLMAHVRGALRPAPGMPSSTRTPPRQ
ncbi:MAG: nitrate reductase molybdenum cofactor assembly chaperone, partial [Pseudomonadota bacterium]|nr:nitrate reductase molybdenum cofactor assembly chaperone [Pseudomonadota bacterium]